jgi:hypothetical protein
MMIGLMRGMRPVGWRRLPFRGGCERELAGRCCGVVMDDMCLGMHALGGEMSIAGMRYHDTERHKFRLRAHASSS